MNRGQGTSSRVALEVYLDGIQDTIVDGLYRAWPDTEDGGLPSPWVRVAATEIEFGFGSVECAPISLSD